MAPSAFMHEPINEMGVVFLFGTQAARLGFIVTHVQAEFPDCEAFVEVAPKRLQRIMIEFELESRNFLKHDHAVDECDMIVCWEHNWPGCPLEVVELKRVMANVSAELDREMGNFMVEARRADEKRKKIKTHHGGTGTLRKPELHH
jgi:hypothetical protein